VIADLKIDVVIVSPGLLEAYTKRGGGIEEIDYNVALGLSNRFSVQLIGPRYRPYLGTTYISHSFTVKQIPYPAIKRYPSSQKSDKASNFLQSFPYSLTLGLSLLGTLIKNRIRVVVVHNGLPGLVASFLARISGRFVVYSEGNTVPWFNPFIIQPNLSLSQKAMYYVNLVNGKLLAMLANVVRTQDDAISEGMVREGIDKDKLRVIPAGVDLPTIMTSSAVERRDNLIRIGFIGRLSDEKGAPLLVEVVRKAAIEIPAVRFVILGEGPHRSSLLELQNVEHIGWVSRSELASWLNGVDIVLFFQKSIGLAELQAMAAGKAVVAGDYKEVSKTIEHMASGILCQPNPESYLAAIKNLIDCPRLKSRVSEGARLTAMNTFNWNVINNKWIELCEELLVE